MKRVAVKAVLPFDKVTPSRVDVAKTVAAAVKADPSLIVVRKIHTKYGTQVALVDAVVYEDANALKTYEPKKKADADKVAGSQEPSKQESKPSEASKDAVVPEKKAESPKQDAKPSDVPKEERPASNDAPKEAA